MFAGGIRRPLGMSVKAWAELVRAHHRLPHSASAILERSVLDPEFFATTFMDWKPTAKQSLWLRGMFKVGHIVAGRRGGKTEVEAVRKARLLILNPAGERKQARRSINVARTVDQSHLVPNTMLQLLSRTKIGQFFIEGVDRAPFMRVHIRGGAEMWARTTQNGGDNLRGHWADDVHRDEASFGQRRDLNVILPMLIDRNGTLSAGTTPNGLNFYHEEYREAQRAQATETRARGILSLTNDVELLDTLALHWTSWDNPYNSREAIERYAKQFSPSAREQEIEAIFRVVEGALVQPGDLDPVPVGIRDDDLELYAEKEYQANAHFVAGIDFGRWRSFTVCIVMRADVKPWRVVAIYADRRKDWGIMKQECEAILTRYRASALLDTTKGSVGDVLHEWIRVPGERFEFSGPSKAQLILNLRLAIQQRAFILPYGIVWEELYRQLSLWGTDEEGDYGDETWDYIMALALAVWQASHRPERPGEHAASSKQTTADFNDRRKMEFRPKPRNIIRRR